MDWTGSPFEEHLHLYLNSIGPKRPQRNHRFSPSSDISCHFDAKSFLQRHRPWNSSWTWPSWPRSYKPVGGELRPHLAGLAYIYKTCVQKQKKTAEFSETMESSCQELENFRQLMFQRRQTCGKMKALITEMSSSVINPGNLCQLSHRPIVPRNGCWLELDISWSALKFPGVHSCTLCIFDIVVYIQYSVFRWFILQTSDIISWPCPNKDMKQSSTAVKTSSCISWPSCSKVLRSIRYQILYTVSYRICDKISLLPV